MPRSTELVWYVSYGSNMAASRLHYYLTGGTPPGARRPHPGARDHRRPRAAHGISIPGEVYFARSSSLWGGGIAFFDPNAPGVTAARAHLVSLGQFSDIAAQEMRRAPDHDLDLTRALATGRDQLGPGWYETLLHLGDRDGIPLLTFTAPGPSDAADPNAPAGPYLQLLAHGLQEAHDWEPAEVSSYLSQLRGARGSWSHAEVSRLLAVAA